MDELFTLQLLHAADQEAGLAAIDDAVNFSAVIEGLADDFENTIRISSGDIFIPGAFFSTSGDIYGEAGIGDILINNALGWDAVTLGNHEFDVGTGDLASLIAADPNIAGPGIGDGGYKGTEFPYLSSNLDVSTDENLAGLEVAAGQTPLPNAITASTVVDVNGTSVGVVGATTPTLEVISNSGDVTVLPANNDIAELAAIIQAEVDSLTALGVNKIILSAHMQQIAVEQELAALLDDVDIVIAGGSNTILGNDDDPLRDGDTAGGSYPLEIDSNGETVYVVNTDGNYRYVGQLVADFDENGVITTINDTSGTFATDQAGVEAIYGEGSDAAEFADPVIVEVTDAIGDRTNDRDGNVFGFTEVFLNGTRGSVRTEETNLGNLTADANLFVAQEADDTVLVSLKNGGGIRDNIGQAIIPPGSTDGELAFLSPPANPAAVKLEGQISQLDIENSLRFNNGLTLLTLTAEELESVLEHGVSGTAPGATPGRFPQVSGINFSFDPSGVAQELTDDGSVITEGQRIQEAVIVDGDGNILDTLVEDGELVGDPNREIRVVTLDFLAGGGDSYPFDVFGEDVVQLEQADNEPLTGVATFINDGTEQDALAEYLAATFPADGSNPFTDADVSIQLDSSIVNLEAQQPVGITLNPLSQINVDAAEILAFDPISGQLFGTNSGGQAVDVFEISELGEISAAFSIDLSGLDPSDGGSAPGEPTSVTVANGIVAIGLPDANEQLPGQVAFYSNDGTLLDAVTVGALPDAVTFTPDGSKVIVSNEGEPDGDVNPEGSISIIDVSNFSVMTADFMAFNGQEDALRDAGVRIFPGIDAANDLEPEFAAVSPDGTTAFVTLQENNAIAVVDIETATVTDIQGLDLQDHNLEPTLTTFEFNEDLLPVISDTETVGEILLGGFSGLHFEGYSEFGNLQFITHPDRGPDDGSRDLNDDGTNDARVYLAPDLQPQVVAFELNPNTSEILVTDQIFLTDTEGNPLTGLPNQSTDDGGRAAVDEDLNPLGEDPLGADLEGIVRAPDGTLWAVDEYRPAIYNFAEDGTLIERFVPAGLDAALGTGALPEVYNTRRDNRGFEGVALQDNLLYAFIQTPLNNPTSQDSNIIRILEFDTTTSTVVGEYLYAQDDMGGGSDKIGDAVATSVMGEFLVLERDSGFGPDSIKNVFRIDISNATNVLDIELEDNATFESLSEAELAQAGIAVVSKRLVADLADLGYDFTDKPEGLTIVDEDTIAVLNDNDFGITDEEVPSVLGLVDFNNSFDASDRDDAINLQNWPVQGLPMPDAIASFEAGGVNYYVTANEGDARDEDARVADLVLAPSAFPNAAELQLDKNLGRLEVSTIDGIAENPVLIATLEGEQEVPNPVDSPFSGEAIIELNETGDALTYSLTFSEGLDFSIAIENFAGDQTLSPGNTLGAPDNGVTGLHFHANVAGQNGPIAFGIIGPYHDDDDVSIVTNADGTTTVSGVWEETDLEGVPLSDVVDQFANTASGEDSGFYFNLHTPANAPGEIRGQIEGTVAYDELIAYGSRSFSIYSEDGTQVFDSGNDFEVITADLIPAFFNSNDGDPAEFDARSDAKGPEPEGVVVGEVGDRVYAFVGLERTGGVMVYDITNPTNSTFVNYINTVDLGNVSPEGLTFIAAEDSPTSSPLLGVSYEESGTLELLEVTTPIYAIQGADQTSPLVSVTLSDLPEEGLISGPEVITSGIVTAVDSNGFFLQDPSGDGDGTTSDGIFVFTGSTPTVTVGDDIRITATIAEFFPGGTGTRNLPTTQLSSVSDITIRSSGNDLPAPTVIGQGGVVPPSEIIDDDSFSEFDPTLDGADFLEAFEGMLVTLEDAVAVAPTNRFGEIFAVANLGADATGLSERGTLTISPDDFNPEKIQIDADSTISPSDVPQVDVGAELGDVTGVLGYNFGNFEIIPTEEFTPTSTGIVTPEVTELAGSDTELSVASYNVLNLDPGDGDQFTALADQIVNNLVSPDIIGLQEIQDNSGSTDDGTTAADVTLQTLVDVIAAAGGPTYAFIDNPFVGDDTNGGQPVGNIRNAFLYNPERVDVDLDSLTAITDPLDQQAYPDNPFFDSRLPLAATFSFNGDDITIVNNHFSSKGGSAAIIGTEQPFEELQEDPNVNGSLDERQDQAAAVNEFVADILASDAAANVVVLGDLNEFEFVSPVLTLEENLTNLTNTLPEDERYTFIFQGNSQTLDHILVSEALLPTASFDQVHVNSEFADQASDHDPVVATFELVPTTPRPVFGTGGPDVIEGGIFRELRFLGGGDDLADLVDGTDSRLYFGAGDDESIGGTDDRFFGQTGEDILDSTEGNGGNRLYGGADNDEIFVGSNDRAFGGPGNDILDSTLSNGGSRLYGGLGNDDFFLGTGDRIVGGNGVDRIFLGTGGENVITGGADADQFWIVTGGQIPESANIVTDFTDGEDVIGFGGLGIGFADLTITSDSDTTIAFGGSDLAVFSGVSAIAESSFVFA
ncbi:MAG: esterase-like activity of phytase family protein [Cyanobacteria bacterium P01_H01_bin.15]